LASVYYPFHDISHKEFNEVLNSLLQRLPQNTHVIMGADINAKLGRQDCDKLQPVQNTHGTYLLSLYLSNGLQVENTLFATPNHYTFTNINDGEQKMINIFANSH